MADMEKVTCGLRCICYGDVECKECPYARDGSGWHDCRSNCAKDALSLLKEQEAVEGHWIVLEFCANEGIYCSKCMNKIFDRSTKPKKKLSNYCPNCGSKNTHFFNPSTEKIMYSD